MNEAVENVCASVEINDGAPVPARVPGGFVVDLLEETGPLDRDEAGLVLSWLEFVEREARGCPALLEGIGRLRGAVMKAATAGEGLRGL